MTYKGKEKMEKRGLPEKGMEEIERKTDTEGVKGEGKTDTEGEKGGGGRREGSNGE